MTMKSTSYRAELVRRGGLRAKRDESDLGSLAAAFSWARDALQGQSARWWYVDIIRYEDPSDWPPFAVYRLFPASGGDLHLDLWFIPEPKA